MDTSLFLGELRLLKLILLLLWLIGASPGNKPAECGNKDCVKKQSAFFVEGGWLKYQVRVEEKDQREICCEVLNGTKNRVHLMVYQKGLSGEDEELIYELRSHEDHNTNEVVVWEKNHPGKEEKTSRVSLTQFNTAGGWDLQCQRGLDGCLFGSYWRSWVNEDWQKAKRGSISLGNQVTWENMHPRRGLRIRHLLFLPVEKTPSEELFEKESDE